VRNEEVMAVPGSTAFGNDGEVDPVLVIRPEVYMIIAFEDIFWPVQ
jgi:hypothetical protein